MFSGIKYILGYADESPNSLKTEEDASESTSALATAIATANDDANKDCKVSMIDDGQENAQDPVQLLDQQLSSNQTPSDDWICDGSIDMVDMDESWYVIPPPCFTGGAKSEKASDEVDLASEVFEQPKAKEAARENALIEHPSFYIASSSKALVQQNEPIEKPVDPPLDLAKRIVLKKAAKKTVRLDIVPQVVVNTLEDAAWVSDDENVLNESDQVKQGPAVAKPDPEPIISMPTNEGQKIAKKNEEPVFRMSSYKKKCANKRPSSHSGIKIKSAAVCASIKPIEKKAWKNKFIVDDWDLDDQEDVDSDFDSMFEPVRKKKSPTKTKRQQKQQPNQNKMKKIQSTGPVVVDEFLIPDLLDELGSEAATPSSSDTPIDIIEQCDNTLDSVELISMRPLPMDNSIIAVVNENEILESGTDLTNNEASDENMKMATNEENRKPPVQVRPIEPERRPGWQLKRQRSKRRPLGAPTAPNKLNSSSKLQESMSIKNDTTTAGSPSSSSRSTPTLIDRIGNSIVSNLTNLTNGLVSSGALNSCSPVNQSPLMEGTERMRQTVANKSNENSVCNMVARKHLSKGFMDRQNICAQQSTRQRRPDRRLKMFTTPNGCSVNRKVHASIH